MSQTVSNLETVGLYIRSGMFKPLPNRFPVVGHSVNVVKQQQPVDMAHPRGDYSPVSPLSARIY
jgi:hypothetical protein